ncbi:peptidoglycan-binding protein [Microvirga arabica]|uniref:Peptidoglycan-binding protein n=3 Tax=Microvirga arabica TaxID=1128671 RepID=A0ABV6YEE0_9HYPH
MPQRYSPSPVNFSRVIILALGFGTITGWGMYALASRSAAEVESQLRGQVKHLHQMQMDLLTERQRTTTAVGDLEQLRSQVSKLRQEADLLTQARDLAQAELVTAATGMKDLINQLNTSGSDVSTTGSINTSTVDAQNLVTATAQKALTKLGYGSLKADGVVGSGTRKAITAFQRANKLHVTGELDAPTLRLLTPGKLASH